MARKLTTKPRWAWGVTGILGLMFGYAFALPMVIGTLSNETLEKIDGTPFGKGLEVLITPLMWLDENFEPYGRFIDWMNSRR